jgi:cobalt-zinc-cadmium efflux system outer membrane protein
MSQAFELAGQQGRRREAAEAEIAAIWANIAETRAALRAEVEQRFVQVLALQLRASVEKQTVSIVERAAEAMAKRLQAGEVSLLDANLARVEAERARNQLLQLDGQLTQARAELGSALQLPPGEAPEARGELGRNPTYTLEDLLQAASRKQQLQTLALRETAARSRLELERAARYPDLTLGLFAGREGPPDLREQIVGLNVSVPLPLFRRNEAGIGRAMTELTQVQVERQAAQRDVVATVRAQWQRVDQLDRRATRLREAVLRILEDNQRLSERSLREGEIGIAELLLVNRQVAETRRELLEAETELRLGRVALERAAGWPSIESKEAK